MVDRKREEERDENEAKPRIKRETVKDLDPKSERSEVKGGGTLKQPGEDQCEAETM